MIIFKDVEKRYFGSPQQRAAVRQVSFALDRGERLGIVGGNGSGKSTLIRLAAGVELPSAGTIKTSMSCSWPIGFGGGFQTTLTGNDNIRFIARVYGVRYESIQNFVQDFSQLDSYLNMPIRTYSSGMRAKLAFALSLAIDFDCLLVDEVISVGDSSFRERCHREIMRRADRSMIFASHEHALLEMYCSKFATLNEGLFVENTSLLDAEHARDEALAKKAVA